MSQAAAAGRAGKPPKPVAVKKRAAAQLAAAEGKMTDERDILPAGSKKPRKGAAGRSASPDSPIVKSRGGQDRRSKVSQAAAAAAAAAAASGSQTPTAGKLARRAAADGTAGDDGDEWDFSALD